MAQHLPIQAKHQFLLKTAHHNTQNISVSAWPSPHAARRNCSRPPGGIHLPPGASVLPDPTGFSSPPGGAHRAARRLLSATLPRHGYRLAVFNGPPGAIPVASCYWFWHPMWLIMQFQNALENIVHLFYQSY